MHGICTLCQCDGHRGVILQSGDLLMSHSAKRGNEKKKHSPYAHFRGFWMPKTRWSTQSEAHRSPLCRQVCVYHDLSDLLRVVSVQIEPKSHHLPVVSLQLTLGHSVSSVGDLRTGGVWMLIVSHGSPRMKMC